MLQELIEAELSGRISAQWNEHTEARTGYRNGHRDKTLATQAGDLDLAIPKLRSGSFFPSLLERRRRIDQALYAVIMEAYVHGVSIRSVDDLVKALGADSGISKSEVSRICGDLDEQLAIFRGRPLDHSRFPYLYLDATYCKVRVNHRIVSQAVVIATGISEDGGREVLGVMSVTARPRRSGASSCAPYANAAWAGSVWSSPTATAAWWPRSARSCSAPPGSAVVFIS
jgi:putative transposase